MVRFNANKIIDIIGKEMDSETLENLSKMSPESLDSFETLRGYLAQFQKKASATTTTLKPKPLIAKLKQESRLKSFRRPNLFAPRRNLIKVSTTSSPRSR